MKADNDADPLLKLVARYRLAPDIHDVFGVILYTEEHPYVIKALRDQDFWNALDKKSGRRWVIFSVKPEQGNTVMRLPEALPGLMQMIVPIPEWREPTENYKLLSVLGIESTEELPMLMVFAEAQGELLRCAFKIAGESKDAAYAVLQKSINVAARSIKDVAPENIKKTFEIFNLVDAAAKQVVTFQRVRAAASLIPYLEKLRSVLSGGK